MTGITDRGPAGFRFSFNGAHDLSGVFPYDSLIRFFAGLVSAPGETEKAEFGIYGPGAGIVPTG
jgi:hypothetical protein